MCEYCELLPRINGVTQKGKVIKSEEDNDIKCEIYEGFMQVSNEFIYDFDLELSFPINYCPMCGRKLNEKLWHEGLTSEQYDEYMDNKI